MLASADSWLGDNPASDSWRSCRASRVALNRSRAAIAAVPGVFSALAGFGAVLVTKEVYPN